MYTQRLRRQSLGTLLLELQRQRSGTLLLELQRQRLEKTQFSYYPSHYPKLIPLHVTKIVIF